MALHSQSGVRHSSPAWTGAVKFLLLVIAVISLYALAQSMVRHRFFSGGYLDDRIMNTGLPSTPEQ